MRAEFVDFCKTKVLDAFVLASTRADIPATIWLGLNSGPLNFHANLLAPECRRLAAALVDMAVEVEALERSRRAEGVPL